MLGHAVGFRIELSVLLSVSASRRAVWNEWKTRHKSGPLETEILLRHAKHDPYRSLYGYSLPNDSLSKKRADACSSNMYNLLHHTSC